MSFEANYRHLGMIEIARKRKSKQKIKPLGVREAIEKLKFEIVESKDGTLRAVNTRNKGLTFSVLANPDGSFTAKIAGPLYTGAPKKYFISGSGNGASQRVACKAAIESAAASFKKVKKQWASEVNSEIGKAYYWLQAVSLTRALGYLS